MADNGKPGLLTRAAQALRYTITGVTTNDWFGPLQPMEPNAPHSVTGRQFDYPVALNIDYTPRGEEFGGVSFYTLRALADNWDILRLVIETRKDQLEALDWSIKSRDSELMGAGKPKKKDKRIQEIEEFFQQPDKDHGWAQWLRMLAEDLFVLDAPTLYIRRTKGQKLFALELMDGSTIKPLIDSSGRVPLTGIAYQQILKGLPAVDYTRDQLIYAPSNPRSNKIYGYSKVEQIVTTANIALRRMTTQLDYFSEGTTPAGMLGMPSTWTPDQIDSFQKWWDGLLSGNLAQRSKMMMVPGNDGGIKYQAFKEPPLKDEFDEWLARIACYSFSVPPTPFVKQMNRATAEISQDVSQDEGLEPVKRYLKRLIDQCIVRFWGADDLEFTWLDKEDQDQLTQAQINDLCVRNGTKSVDEVRADMGFEPIGMSNAVYTGTGPVLVKDILEPHACGDDGAGGGTGGDQGSNQAQEEPATGAENAHRTPYDGKPPMDKPGEGPEVGKKANAPFVKARGTGHTEAVQSKLEKIFTKLLAEQGDKLLAEILRAYPRLGKAAGDSDATPDVTPEEVVLTDAERAAALAQIQNFIKGLDFADWGALAPEIGEALSQAYSAGGMQGLGEAGIYVPEDIDSVPEWPAEGMPAVTPPVDVTPQMPLAAAAEEEATAGVAVNQVNQSAIQYATSRAAGLVGKKVIDGQLFDNPDPEYAITESTRNQLQSLVTKAIEEGWSNQQLATEIRQATTFSRERAILIARTETAFAESAGNMAAYRASGVVEGKKWILSPLHDHDDECDDNADAGDIGLDENFPDGCDTAPAHPNCTCAVVPVLRLKKPDVLIPD